MKYEKIGLDPEAAQFLQSRKFQVNEIARIFRIPPSYLADLREFKLLRVLIRRAAGYTVR